MPASGKVVGNGELGEADVRSRTGFGGDDGRRALLDWAMVQPVGRFDLLVGRVMGMAPETAGDLRTRGLSYQRFGDAIAAAGLPCEALPDGANLVVDETKTFEPDVTINCGEPMKATAVIAPSPVIVVEVVSRSSRRTDTSAKLVGYFRVPSIRHYPIRLPDSRTVIPTGAARAGRSSPGSSTRASFRLPLPACGLPSRPCSPTDGARYRVRRESETA